LINPLEIRIMRSFKALLIAAVTVATLAVPAFADTITLTLLNPAQDIAAGQTVTFNATLSASIGNTGDVFLNQDSINAANGVDSSLIIDDSDFFGNFPISISPGGSITDALFTITNTGSITRAYTGSFVLFGGADGDSFDTLANVSFGSPTIVSAVPEPSSLLMIGTGVAGLVSFGKRRLTR
jgi:hypothetical protein